MQDKKDFDGSNGYINIGLLDEIDALCTEKLVDISYKGAIHGEIKKLEDHESKQLLDT